MACARLLPGPASPVLWNPPFRWAFANDLNLPHVWNIVLTFARAVAARRGPRPSPSSSSSAALYTWREALIGFVARGR